MKDRTNGDNGEKLNGHMSDEEYLICIEIWNEFNMKNMGDYYDHYFKKDVLLLAVFEKFIDMCLKFYKLDPCHYFSSPGLNWDAMLNMTGVKSYISYIAKSYSKGNNRHMKNYDPTKLS